MSTGTYLKLLAAAVAGPLLLIVLLSTCADAFQGGSSTPANLQPAQQGEKRGEALAPSGAGISDGGKPARAGPGFVRSDALRALDKELDKLFPPPLVSPGEVMVRASSAAMQAIERKKSHVSVPEAIGPLIREEHKVIVHGV